jgi:hypothetical protein
MTSDPQRWEDWAACEGLDPGLWFLDKGHVLSPKAKQTCHDCPVFFACLEQSLGRRETHGGWAGAAPRTRRVLWHAWVARTHDYDPACTRSSCWCRVAETHRESLIESSTPLQLNGPGARCGKRSTYARGCRCLACRTAISPTGVRMRDAGIDILAWFERWFDGDARYDDSVMPLVRRMAKYEITDGEAAAA